MRHETTYQIYTFGTCEQAKKRGDKLLRWGLHAASAHKEAILLHARMLSLDPHYEKIQVEKIYFDDKTGQKRNKTIKVLNKNRKHSVLGKLKSFIAALSFKNS